MNAIRRSGGKNAHARRARAIVVAMPGINHKVAALVGNNVGAINSVRVKTFRSRRENWFRLEAGKRHAILRRGESERRRQTLGRLAGSHPVAIAGIIKIVAVLSFHQERRFEIFVPGAFASAQDFAANHGAVRGVRDGRPFHGVRRRCEGNAGVRPRRICEIHAGVHKPEHEFIGDNGRVRHDPRRA